MRKRQVEAFGTVFDSESEVKFHSILLQAKKNNIIEYDRKKDRQVCLPIHINGSPFRPYTIDFRFKHLAQDKVYLIEVKAYKRKGDFISSYDAYRFKVLQALYPDFNILMYIDRPRKPLHIKRNNEILNLLGIV